RSAGPPRGARSAWGRRRRHAGESAAACATPLGPARRPARAALLFPSPLGEARGGGRSFSSSPRSDLLFGVADRGPEGFWRRHAALERPRSDQPGDLVLLEDFLLEQRGGEHIEFGAVFADDPLRALVALGEHTRDLLIDDRGGALADVRIAGQLAAEEDCLRRVVEGKEAHLLAHPPAD